MSDKLGLALLLQQSKFPTAQEAVETPNSGGGRHRIATEQLDGESFQ